MVSVCHHRFTRLLPWLLLLAAAALTHAHAQHVAVGPWSGGVTSDAASIVARLYTPRFSTLEVSDDPDFAHFVSFGESSPRPGDQPEMSRFRAVGLKPLTRYHYRIRIGSQHDGQRRGSFMTMPLEGKPTSFRFALSAGATTGSAHGVYSEIKSQAPMFFVVAGNLFDTAIGASDRAAFRAAYEEVLMSPNQADLYRTVPIVYTWDAYDYGAGGGAVPARAAAHASFREYVPHFGLVDPGSPDGTINRAFTIGRVRFLVLDVRTERGPPGTTLLGERQLAWFKAELLAAKDRHPLVFVVSPSSWLSPAAAGRDDWGRYAAERDALSDWIAENGIKGLCFLGGDGSVLAADDGTNNRYGQHKAPGFPVLQAGPLDRGHGTGTGPWTHGPITPEGGEGFFAMIDVTDAEGRISVSFRGLNQHGQERLKFSFQVPAPVNVAGTIP